MKVVTIKGHTLGSGQPKIVVPLVGTSAAEILAEAKAASQVAAVTVVEWRADHFAGLTDSQQVVALTKELSTILADKVLLFTIRSQQEGGAQAVSAATYFALYQAVLSFGQVDLIDLELFMDEANYQTLYALARTKHVPIILCNHEFTYTPDEATILARLAQMEAKGAALCKLAVMPQCAEDVLTLMQATLKRQAQAQVPLVTMSMGALGAVSRLAGELCGSALTFGSLKQASAPGQLPVADLAQGLQWLTLEQ